MCLKVTLSLRMYPWLLLVLSVCTHPGTERNAWFESTADDTAEQKLLSIAVGKNELESLKEKMAKTGEEIQSKLDEKEENVNNLKKQMENKTKCLSCSRRCVEILKNKVLKKKITAESKKNSIYEGKVEKMRLLYEEVTVIQRETDIRCQHKITEMVALMEKHKSILLEEEMFKKLCKDYLQASQLHSNKKGMLSTPAPSNVESPGSALKLKTMRRMREAGWTGERTRMAGSVPLETGGDHASGSRQWW
ncbi:hypothetical protein Nmel_018254 [Mimus melanotis]